MASTDRFVDLDHRDWIGGPDIQTCLVSLGSWYWC